MLHPVFRIYHFVFDVKDAGVDATAEARGSPLSPKGYTAEGDVKLRGVDALPALIDDAPFAAYLPLLKELGKPDKTADGTSVLGFRIASTPQQRLSLNGHDITAWISDDKPGPAASCGRRTRRWRVPTSARCSARWRRPRPRTCRRAGSMTARTAAAVARYQKQAGINVSGAVDAATRDRLGVKPAAEPGKPGVPAPRRYPPSKVLFVIPAQAGIHSSDERAAAEWIPAFAGMTVEAASCPFASAAIAV